MENRTLTLGSLFDGSGGFPLGGILCGIKPLWASEIEPFPIRVTTKKIPDMKHLGDISRIKGSEIEPVDIITFGSPCQDMSIAGKREGLDGERSGLFYEALRIVREMREATDGQYPRFIVWENVPGAFSSNKGDDFRAVIQEIVNVKYKNMSVPKSEKWASAGLIVEDDFSLAWRVLDAQYWGVPQRRKRIYLVADFRGGCAGKILFESEGLSWNSEKSLVKEQGSAASSADGTGETEPECLMFENHSQDSRYKGPLDKSQPITSNFGMGGNNQPLVMKSPTFDVRRGPNAVADPHFSSSKASFFTNALKEQTGTLVATDYKDPPIVNDKDDVRYIVRRLTPTECARLQGFPDWWCSDLETENPSEDEVRWWKKVFQTFAEVTGRSSKPKSDSQIIKWLQNPQSDAAEYKMWGNGVALPCVIHVLAGISYFSKVTGEQNV